MRRCSITNLRILELTSHFSNDLRMYLFPHVRQFPKNHPRLEKSRGQRGHVDAHLKSDWLHQDPAECAPRGCTGLTEKILGRKEQKTKIKE